MTDLVGAGNKGEGIGIRQGQIDHIIIILGPKRDIGTDSAVLDCLIPDGQDSR